MTFAGAFVIVLVISSSAFAQIDTFKLRSKYGEPLDRKTFTVRPGIDMVVDYGPNKIVCKLQLPAGTQTRFSGTPPPGIITKQQVDEVLEEVVPSAMRGKEIGKMSPFAVNGMPVPVLTQYENVSISEFPTRELNGGRIVVIFKVSACPKYDPFNPGSPQ